MNQEEWRSRLAAAIELQKRGQNDEALSSLGTLASELERDMLEATSDWHHSETVGLKAVFWAQAGQPERAEQEYQALAHWYRERFRFYGRALAAALSWTALSLEKRGQRGEASELSGEALGLMAQFSSPTVRHDHLDLALKKATAKKRSSAKPKATAKKKSSAKPKATAKKKSPKQR